MYKKFGYLLLSFFFLGILGLFIAPKFIDWNNFRTEIQDQLSKKLNRPVIIEGDIKIALIPQTTTHLERVLILSEDKTTALADIDEITLKQNFLSFFRPTIRADNITLTRPTFHLPLLIGDTVEQEISALPNQFSFDVKKLTLKEATFYLQYHATEDPLVLNSTNISLKGAGPTGPYYLDYETRIEGQLWSGSLTTGRLGSKTSLPIDLKALEKTSNIAARFKGTTALSLPLYLKGEFSLSGSVFDFSDQLNWAKLFGQETKPELSLTGNLDLLGGYGQLKSAHIETPFGQLEGKLALSPTNKGLKISSDLSSTLLNFENYTSPAAVLRDILRLNALSLTSDRILLETKLYLESLKTQNNLARQFNLEAVCSAETCHFADISVQIPGGTNLAISADLSNLKQKPQYHLDFNASGLNLKRALAWINLPKSTQYLSGISATKLNQFDLKGTISGGDKHVTLEALTGKIDQTKIDLKVSHENRLGQAENTVTLSLAGGTPFDYFGTTGGSPLPLFRQKLNDLFLSPRFTSFTVPFGAILQQQNLSFNITATDFKIEATRYKSLQTSGHLNQDVFALKQFDLINQTGGTLSFDGTIAHLDAPTLLNLNLDIHAQSRDAVHSFDDLLPELSTTDSSALQLSAQIFQKQNIKQISLNAQADQTQLSVSGKFDKTAETQTPLRVRITHPDATRLLDQFLGGSTHFKHNYPKSLDLYFEADESASGDWNIHNIQSLLGKAGITGNLTFSPLDGSYHIKGDLNFSDLSLPWLTELILPATRLHFGKGWLPTPLTVDWAHSLTGTLNLHADRLHLSNTEKNDPLTNLNIKASLSPNALSLSDGQASFLGGDVTMAFSLPLAPETQDATGMTLEAAFHDIHLPASTDQSKLSFSGGLFSGKTSIACTGHSFREFAQSCHGDLDMSLADPLLQGADLSAIALGLVEGTDLNRLENTAFTSNSYTKFTPFSAHFTVKEGKISTEKPLLLKFDYGLSQLSPTYQIPTKTLDLTAATLFTTLPDAPALRSVAQLSDGQLLLSTDIHSLKSYLLLSKETPYLNNTQDAALSYLATRFATGDLNTASQENHAPSAPKADTPAPDLSTEIAPILPDDFSDLLNQLPPDIEN